MNVEALFQQYVLFVIGVGAAFAALVLGFVLRYRGNRDVTRSKDARINTNIQTLRERLAEFVREPESSNYRLHVWTSQTLMYYLRMYWLYNVADGDVPHNRSVVVSITIDQTSGEVWIGREQLKSINANTPASVWKDFVGNISHQVELYQPVRRVG